MAKRTGTDQDEALQEELDPHRQEVLRRAMLETSARLRDLGVRLTGGESSEELVTLLETVERFEVAVESRGGDLMVDEGPSGTTREPDDVHFVLPRRQPGQPVAEYLAHVEKATRAVMDHPALES